MYAVAMNTSTASARRRPLRVGMFTYGMGRYTTGIGRYASELCGALRRADPTLQLWLLNPYPPTAMPWFGAFPNRRLSGVATLPGVLMRGHAELARAAHALQLDIVHDPTGVGPFLARRRGVRRVLTVHDAIPLVAPHLQPVLTRLVFRTLVAWSPHTADAVLTPSRSAQRDVLHHVAGLADRLIVVPPGTRWPSDRELAVHRAAAERAKWAGTLPAHYLLAVGNQDPRKNAERLFAAFRLVRAARPDVALVMAGPDTWGRRSALAAGIPDGVHYLGYVSDDQLATAYAGAAVVVFPSLYEGFGLPALEGMAHGVPVVASNRSALPEVTGEAAILVNPEDVDALAAAVIRLLTDDGLARRLAVQGRRRAERFTWDATAATVLDLYRGLVGG